MSWKAQQRYIDTRSDRVKLNVLSQDAVPLPPRHRTWKSFKKEFDNKNNFEFTFCGYSFVINTRYAFKHFSQNTYSEPREHLNATITKVIEDPIIVVHSSHEEKETIVFYKPFKNTQELVHMMLFHADRNSDGKYHFNTTYSVIDNINKVKNLLKTTEEKVIYFKYD